MCGSGMAVGGGCAGPVGHDEETQTECFLPVREWLVFYNTPSCPSAPGLTWDIHEMEMSGKEVSPVQRVVNE